jgi:hypothetical protein
MQDTDINPHKTLIGSSEGQTLCPAACKFRLQLGILRRKSQFRQGDRATHSPHTIFTHRTAIISPMLHDMSLIF